jgi:hypothetical protein
MFMGSCAGMGVCLAIITGVMAKYQHDNSDTNASSAMIAFIFIFGVVFDVGFTSMQPIYSPEVLASTCWSSCSYCHATDFQIHNMRANGTMVSQITSGCAGFVNTFAAPLAVQNISYWL